MACRPNRTRCVIYTDSRGKNLDTFITKHNDTDTQILINYYRGAGIQRIGRKVSAHLNNFPNDMIIFMAGINDVTSFSEKYHKYWLDSADGVYEKLATLIGEEDRGLYTRFPNAAIIYAPIVGMDLAIYTGDNDASKQATLNEAIIKFNNHLTELNEAHSNVTPWTASPVHKHRKKDNNYEYQHHYGYLYDGLHPKDYVLDKWALAIMKMIKKLLK